MRKIEDTTINNVENFEDVEKYFRWLGERRNWLAFDTETGGLEFWKQPLRLVQIGDVDEAWVFRADRWLGVIEDSFKKYEGRWVGQNVGFDIRFLKCQGGLDISWSNVHDTKVMAHLCNPGKSTSLKALGRQFLSPKARKLQGTLNAAMSSQGWGWADIPYDYLFYWAYGGFDCIITARIADKFWPEIESKFKTAYELEMEVSRICSDMEMRGTRVDLPYCHMKLEQLNNLRSDLEVKCADKYGVRPSENLQVSKKLIELGVDLTKVTDTGAYAVDKDVLEGVDHELARLVLEHRKATKISSSYFKNFIGMHDNGVLHPSINTLGARTGRMSANNPALQTLPRGRVVRDAFIPRPDHRWVSVDFDNIEMKLLAHFCQDPGMLEAARTQDMHLEMAKLAYQDDSIEKKDPRRQTFKNANFAKAFVAGVERFAETAGLSYEEADQFLGMYDKKFPGVRAFQSRVEVVAQQRFAADGQGYVFSPLGRKHVADNEKKFYTLVNYLIQGTAAEVFKQSLVDLDLSGFGPYMLLPVHDEQNFELPVDEANEMIVEIERLMTQNDWSVPLTVSAEGPFEKWGDKAA